ncbi:MAG: ABC transporter ATP-binding protein, partial [Gemmatimonadaceae bacterium]|nr:ABC transporter ATP-binding protein [Gemmatimonadaceae bacterium]
MTHPFGPMVSRGRRMNEKPPSWRERLSALRYVLPMMRLIWRTHRGYTASMLGLRLVRAFVPVATFWVGKLILDTVIAIRDGQATYGELWRYVAIEIAIVVTGEILARASSLIESLLSDLFSNDMSIRLMEHAATLDL